MTSERAWALRRIKAGDYLLPSNDKQTLWRITRGEDGAMQWWDLCRWDGGVNALLEIAESIEDQDWERWHLVTSPRTREDAIQAALRLE